MVVGGGISGLAAAHRLIELAPDSDVTVLERATRPGGLIGTTRIDDCLVELGPDSILTEKPAALELARRLGLESEIVGTGTAHRGAYVVCRGKLERIPEGFSMMGPAEAWPVLRSPILSPAGKLRMLAETLLPRGPGGDESVGRFVQRRFGKEVLERLAQPLMGGIYGTDVNLLSLQATMPRFATMEAEHGSVTLGLMRKASAGKAKASGVRYGLFVSFRGGVQTLTDALARTLGERLRLGDEATSLTRLGDGSYELGRAGQPPLVADAVVLALPARPLSRLVAPLDAAFADALLDIPYGSSAAVYLCFERADVPHPLDAFGFVVPKVERRRVMASTWASVKFPGRAPDDRALLRFFFGGDGQEEMLELSDERLVRAARAEAEALLGIRAEPRFCHVSRHPHAMPKYLLGHHQRVRAIEQQKQRHPGLELAGNSMYGVGIPDAVASGERAAERVVAAWQQTGRTR